MVLILLLTVNALAQSTPATNSVTDHALTAKIERCFHDSLVNEDDSREIAKAKDLYERTGLPTLGQVGDQAAYEFVVLLASDRLPMAFRSQVLVRVKREAARHELPADAATFYEVRLHLEQLKQEAEARPPSDPGLRDEIERMCTADQAFRQQKGFEAKKLTETDQRHAGPLRVILEKYGVPTYSMVGPQAAGDFVTMIQHQPAPFRQEVLPQLKANVAKGEADPQSYALVYDRSQRDSGKQQLYGEQLECKAGGTLQEAPIENEAQVNRRRAELGLIRMELYAHMVKETMPQFCAPSAIQK